MPFLTLGADMTRPSRTGGKTSEAKARNASAAKGRKTTKNKRRIAPAATRVKRSVSGPSNDLKVAREQQAATAEILKVIASSPDDVQPVLEAVAERAMNLLDAWSVLVTRFDGELLRFGAARGALPDTEQFLRNYYPMRPEAAVFAGRCILERTAINISDAQADPSPQNRERARLRGFRAALSVPMLRDGQAIGVITVSRIEAGAFAANEVALLQTFADQAVIAIENVRLFNETKEALERQTAMADILKVIASSPADVKPVFHAIATSANRLIGGHSTTVLRIVGDMAELAAFTSVSPEADEALRALFPRPIFASDMQLAQVLQGEVMEITDTEGASELITRNLARSRGFRSRLLVPLRSDNDVLGVISITRKEPGPFAKHDVELLQTFADQAVIAIENVRLFDEVKTKTDDLTESLQQQTATADVLKVISRSAFDLDAVLVALVESAARLCEADNAFVYQRDADMFRLAATHGFSADYEDFMKKTPVQPGRGTLIGRTTLEAAVVHIPDVLADPEYRWRESQERAGYRTMLGVPLLREGIPIGVLAMTRTTVRPFSEKQIALLTTFADQAVIAIENVRLFDEVQAKTRDLTEALTYQTGSSNILSVIASSPTSVEPVLNAIVRSACELCDAYDAFVRLKNGDNLAFGAHFGPIPVTQDSVPISRGWTAGLAVIEQRPVHIHDLLSADGDEFPEARELGRRENHRTILSVPLVREGESVGAIVLRRTEVHPFSDKQIALLQTFADQAVIAIENVKLFEEVQARTFDLQESLEQQTATSEVLQVISSSSGELDPVFNKMLENATRICGARFGTMTLYEDGGFRTVALYNAPKAYADTQLYKVIRPHPESGLSAVQRTRKSVYIADIRKEPPYVEGNANVRALADLGGARTIIIVPMLRDNELVGTITIYRQEVKPFTDKQTELVSHFANQAVIAIENARLLNELRERTEELSRSLEDLRAAQDRLVQTEKLASLGQLTAGIAHEIKNPLNFVNNFSALSAELVDEMTDVFENPALDEANRRKELDEIRDLLKSNLEKVVQHGKRADSIVKNMLLHSREGSREHRPADINSLLDESLNLAYHGARAEKGEFNVTLQRDFDVDAGIIELFPQEITRAFLNLIANGVYAATRRKTEDKELDFEPTLRATTKNLGTTVEIRIRDNGTGIPIEVQEKMFNPFFTTKPAGEGTGLGLSMTHDIIVKQHGGRIDVETEPGIFTEFIITLPRTTIPQKTAGGTN
jgi:two-component system NtrC family sensor kinase